MTFLINKVLLFQFYQKTNTLNRVVPNYSMSLLNLSIVFHLVVGLFMLTNSSIFEVKKETSKGFGFQESANAEQSWIGKRIQYPHQIIYIIFVTGWLLLMYGT